MSLPAPVAPLIVFVTVPTQEAGVKLARLLVEEQLAACVNLVPGVRSLYAWEGEVKDESEVLCLIKTRAELFRPLQTRIAAVHPYEVPEILGVVPALANEPYLHWLAEATVAPVRA